MRGFQNIFFDIFFALFLALFPLNIDAKKSGEQPFSSFTLDELEQSFSEPEQTTFNEAFANIEAIIERADDDAHFAAFQMPLGWTTRRFIAEAMLGLSLATPLTSLSVPKNAAENDEFVPMHPSAKNDKPDDEHHAQQPQKSKDEPKKAAPTANPVVESLLQRLQVAGEMVARVPGLLSLWRQETLFSDVVRRSNLYKRNSLAKKQLANAEQLVVAKAAHNFVTTTVLPTLVVLSSAHRERVLEKLHELSRKNSGHLKRALSLVFDAPDVNEKFFESVFAKFGKRQAKTGRRRSKMFDAIAELVSKKTEHKKNENIARSKLTKRWEQIVFALPWMISNIKECMTIDEPAARRYGYVLMTFGVPISFFIDLFYATPKACLLSTAIVGHAAASATHWDAGRRVDAKLRSLLAKMKPADGGNALASALLKNIHALAHKRFVTIEMEGETPTKNEFLATMLGSFASAQPASITGALSTWNSIPDVTLEALRAPRTLDALKRVLHEQATLFGLENFDSLLREHAQMLLTDLGVVSRKSLMCKRTVAAMERQQLFTRSGFYRALEEVCAAKIAHQQQQASQSNTRWYKRANKESLRKEHDASKAEAASVIAEMQRKYRCLDKKFYVFQCELFKAKEVHARLPSFELLLVLLDIFWSKMDLEHALKTAHGSSSSIEFRAEVEYFPIRSEVFVPFSRDIEETGPWRMVPEDSTKQTCPICLERLDWASDESGRIRRCKHRFHKHCLSEWSKNEDFCPECRKFFLMSDFKPLFRHE